MRNLDETNVPHTCPLIDDVINYLKYLKKHFGEDEYFEKIDYETSLQNLETIREANDLLRTFGLNYKEEFDLLENDKEYFERQVREKEFEIYNLEQKIALLETKLDDVETSLYEANNEIYDLKYELDSLNTN